jgi:hypothetical protein
MANWQNYWRIITPTSRKATYEPRKNPVLDDGYDLNTAGYSSFASTSWFSNLMKGSASRLQRYKQFDSMDSGDIARALDTIAEEMSGADPRTGLPFIIDYQIEESQTISDTTATTLRAALRYWCTFHKMSTRVYSASRYLVKYGDCFFRKKSDTTKWEYVDATRVIGIEIDRDNEVAAYHIRPAAFGAANSGDPNQTPSSLEIVPAAAILHFSTSSEMGDNAPFGKSVLQDVMADYNKLTMLEGAAIIYRIVRAPERRVFYIDVGNAPPQRVKMALEQVKNDIRQRRTPNVNNAQQADGQYNPESIQEDFFFPVTAAGRGSRVETLPGGSTWEIPELDYFLKKVLNGLRVPSSYMRGSDAAGAQYTDGKVGIAYIEEQRFYNYVKRLQQIIEEIMDTQFKIYLKVAGINVDPELFRLRLPEPQNFVMYRQAALDADLINAFKSVEDTSYLSKRFVLKRYLQLTEDEIQINETLLKQERNLDKTDLATELQQIYDPSVSNTAVSLPGAEMGSPLPSGPEDAFPTDAPIDLAPPPASQPPAGGSPV